MADERPFADLLQELHGQKKTGALYVTIVEASEDMFRIYFREGDIYFIRYGSAFGQECLDILEYYNLWGATYFNGIVAPKGAFSEIPTTPEIISTVRRLNKNVKVK